MKADSKNILSMNNGWFDKKAKGVMVVVVAEVVIIMVIAAAATSF